MVKQKRTFINVRLEKKLSKEMIEFLPIYSKFLGFHINQTGFVEKSVRECLEKEKNKLKNFLDGKC